ncbi:MAG: MFS transporter [Bacteroidia bacterium]|nr:MFS transporter [Bacteroidia bacterium]
MYFVLCITYLKHMINSAKLSFKEKFGYGLGDTACHFAWDMAGMFLFFYFTDVYGISAAVAGTIMLVARVWDAISDPLIGIIADRTNTKNGKFRPYMVWFAIPLGVSLVLLFTTPDFDETGKIIWAACMYLFLSTAYTAVNLPYSALSGVMTADSAERTQLNQYRFFMGFLGMFIVSFTMYAKNYLITDEVLMYAQSINLPQEALLFIQEHNWGSARELDTSGGLKDVIVNNERKAFQFIAIVMAIIGTVFLFISYAMTKERIQPPENQKSNLKEDIKNVFGVKAWLILFILGIITFVLINIQGAVINQYFKYYVGNENGATLLYTLTTVSLIIGVLFATPLTKRFEKRTVYLACSAISGLFTIALFIPGKDDFYMLHTINVLSKLAIAPTIPLLWSMIADTADFSEWKNNRRATGLFFSATTFAQKIGGGIAVALAGLLLTMAKYDGEAIQQTDESIMALKMSFSVIPGVLYLLTAALLFWYDLDDSKVEKIKLELTERRTSS